MVLTNFECWAHGDPTTAATFETGTLRPSMDPFNPRDVTFMTDANNNNNNNNNQIEGQPMPENLHLSVLRCKKRLNPGQTPDEDADLEQPVYTKRCRYDEADLAAQYCNDFFSLPATQVIGTQACLMDYEMQATGGMMMESETSFPAQQQQHQQPQQQQQHQRINQHYQESAEQRPSQQKSRKCQDPIEKIKIKSIGSEAEADLYIATHGGCLHHFSKLSRSELEESDI
ncbi:putative mediator of RNA polymerase II transcription subunit 29 [Drosophila eugracilis]|uniref:putative mediator of RNA polymerase II transcription subunit 29 n=1 Tax=Drosophila eugracilis TaxID=29029 RepID=UPI0007E82F57|nr:putative mediator of RNA polymerase II transcription subunit 29 [Drosophila eugracilis]